jgi:hypothetical protein
VNVHRYLLPFLRVFLVSGVLTASAHASDFFTLRTGAMRLVYYSKEHSFIVPHLARSFENSLRFHRRLFNYTPSEEVLVFLQDYDDYGYAGATSIPHNYMILGISPYEYTYETSPTNERINWVISHELMHIVASDPAAGSDRFFRSLFAGKVLPTEEDPPSMLYTYLASPRKYAPRWYHEGIAVFMETWMSGGIGRAQNGFDEMVFRTMVRDRSPFYDFVGLESEGTTIDFQIGANSYLYGTRFVSYLADTFGPESLVRWFSRTDTSDASYQAQFERVYGDDIDEVWSRWIAWEQTWQKANLDSIRQYPITPVRPLTPGPVGAVSRAHLDAERREILVGMNMPGIIAHLGAVPLDGGERRRLTDVPTPSLYNVASTAFDPESHRLFYTTKNAKGWRDLCVVNTRTGETDVLLKHARIGDLAWNRADGSLWGVQHHNGTSRLVRLPPPYTSWQELLPLRYGIDLYDPDIAPDGSALVASMMEINGRQRLVRLSMDSLLSGSADYDVLWEFDNTAPLNFVYSRDGRYLYGSTYQTGVSNIVRYDVAARSMEWLTNVETGLFRPLEISTDSLVAFSFSTGGFTPVAFRIRPIGDVSPIQYLGARIADRYPIVREWKIPPPSPSRINVDSLTLASGDYEGLWALGLNSLYPIVHGYKNSVAGGLRFNFLDPLLLHGLDVSVLYSPVPSHPVEERLHGILRYEYGPWRLKGTYNASDFYDLFGPTKRSRKGYSLTAAYRGSVIDDAPEALSYSLQAGGFGGLERLPAFQNIATTTRDFLTLTGSLSYRKVLRSLGAVDAEKGVLASVTAHSSYARTTAFPLVYGTLDGGIPLFQDHSSLWVRTAGGYSFGDPDQSFSNFYFGGFGNNWVDHGDIRRYREETSFPGAELNSIAGSDFARVLVEWNPPPLRFRRLGVPAFYCTWARLAVFTGGLLTDIGTPDLTARAGSVGAQVDFRLVLFSNLSSTLSFGYARAAAERMRATEEFMVSLKIL